MMSLVRSSLLVSTGLTATLAACADFTDGGINADCNGNTTCVNTADGECVDVELCAADQTTTSNKTDSMIVGTQTDCSACADLTDTQCHSDAATTCVLQDDGNSGLQCDAVAAACGAGEAQTANPTAGANDGTAGTQRECKACADLTNTQCHSDAATTCVLQDDGSGGLQCDAVAAACGAGEVQLANPTAGANDGTAGTQRECKACADLTDTQCHSNAATTCVLQDDGSGGLQCDAVAAACGAGEVQLANPTAGADDGTAGTQRECKACTAMSDTDCLAESTGVCVLTGRGTCVAVEECGSDEVERGVYTTAGGIEYGSQPECDSAGTSISPMLAGTMAVIAIFHL